MKRKNKTAKIEPIIEKKKKFIRQVEKIADKAVEAKEIKELDVPPEKPTRGRMM